MLTVLGSLLGIGGVAGLALRFLMPGAITRGLGLLDRLPSWLIYGLTGVLVLGGAYLWHGHTVKVARHEGYVAGEAAADGAWQSSFHKMQQASNIWRGLYETKSDMLSNEIRKNHEQDLRANATRADDLRLRGPGKAALGYCGPQPSTVVAGPAGGPDAPAAQPGAPPAEVPGGDRQAVLSWGFVVRTGQEHDDAVAENAAWRAWYVRQKELYDSAVARLRADLAKIKPDFGELH